ncbi:hypothetical protein HC823_00555 [Candidatus Gracilibacteria bacterium]|nr:hypothetical protein [Candidatus Gracilibacteria bacterium]
MSPGSSRPEAFLGDGTGLTGFALNLSIGGNATTASALEADPIACPDGEFVSDIDADGTLTCEEIENGNNGSSDSPKALSGISNQYSITLNQWNLYGFSVGYTYGKQCLFSQYQ